jgi:glycosyltransferase involved in cell wall biosynthesis
MDTVPVSVVIPTFNRAGILREALDSVLSQGIDGIEAIVVDDGSTDGTRAVVESYGEPVRYLHQPNRGPAAARNHGIARARGELVSLLDSDDFWLPGKTAAELAVLRRFPEVDAVISDSEIWQEGRLTVASRFARIGCALPAGRTEIFLEEIDPVWVEHSLFSTCCLTFRRSLLRRLGDPPFDTTLRSYEDWDFELRLYQAGRVAVLPRVLARVRRLRDETRGDRPLPGTPPPWTWTRRQIEDRSEILGRLLGFPRLAPEVARRAQALRRQLAQELAAGPPPP